MTSIRKRQRRLAAQARRSNPRRRSARRAAGTYAPTYEPSSPAARAIEYGKKFLGKSRKAKMKELLK